MLLLGTLNPQGESNAHAGVLLKERDIDSLVSSNALLNKPVLIEHQGPNVGFVVSAWKHEGRIDAILKINNDNIDSLFAQNFIESRRCPELSLGYTCHLTHSADGLHADYKEVNEVSLVVKGARHDCHIRAWKR